jgi:hypothetical protein
MNDVHMASDVLLLDLKNKPMLTPTRASALDAIATVSRSSPSNRVDLQQNTTSFGEQLAASLEGFLKGAPSGANLTIDVLPTENSGARQFLVTMTGSDSTASTPTRGTVTVPSDPITNSAAPTNEVDAYWATQPEEVQILRTIDDPVERAEMGQKLANQGFEIDPNIMIHRWDPYMTMKIRQGEGYTWIPAIGQDGIPVSPGLIFPGLPRYDPDNPPQGSIRVTTDFALGLEHTSPGAGNTHFSSSLTS